VPLTCRAISNIFSIIKARQGDRLGSSTVTQEQLTAIEIYTIDLTAIVDMLVKEMNHDREAFFSTANHGDSPAKQPVKSRKSDPKATPTIEVEKAMSALSFAPSSMGSRSRLPSAMSLGRVTGISGSKLSIKQ
jgi:hypothetical protein